MNRFLVVMLASLAAHAAGAAPAVRFAVLADQTGSAMPGVYDSVLAEVARLDPDFIVTVGDQVQGYVGPDTAVLQTQFDDLFAQYDRAFGPRWRSGGFLVLTPGNHDITDNTAEPIWRARVGPPSRRVDLGGVTILVLDTTRISDDGVLPADQVAFLERELADLRVEQPVIIATHKPFFANGVWKGNEDPSHGLFVKHGVDAVLAGHWHDYVYEPRDGVEYMVCGSSGGSTGGQGEENGEFIGFVWGTVREGRINLTPIALGGIREPDFFNWAEDLAMLTFNEKGLHLSPFALGTAASSIRVIARNPGDKVTADTLRWSVPGNWRISPQSAPFHAAAGDSVVTVFEAGYTGSPFPLPTLSTAFHYGRGKSLTANVPLRIDRTAQCPAVRKIKVDGVIGREEWAASRAENLLMAPDGGESFCDETEFFYAHDADGVYLAARCVIRADRPCVANVVKRDGPIPQDDCAGWLISPADSTVVQIYVNPAGTLLDGWGKAVGGDVLMDYAWNGKLRAATTRESDHWSVEVHVPYETLGMEKGLAPAELRLNFRRKQPAVKSSADWMPFDFSPATMGRLALVM